MHAGVAIMARLEESNFCQEDYSKNTRQRRVTMEKEKSSDISSIFALFLNSYILLYHLWQT